MHATHQARSIHQTHLVFRTALLAALLIIACLAATRSQAGTNLCETGVSSCSHAAGTDYRFLKLVDALQASDVPETLPTPVTLSDQEYFSFSGVGVISCSVNGQRQTATAFLVGAFDIAVTVAHSLERDGEWADPSQCAYTSMDSLGQIRERIPVSYIKAQWASEAGAFGQPAKDLAVVRLAEPSRFAQRTMPLGKFSGAAAPVVMVGFKSDIDADTVKRKARGTVYERRANGVAISNLAGFAHDIDSRGIAPGAPVIDERSGVIIGIHTRLGTRRNSMITMNDWLETTLHAEMALQPQTAAKAAQ
jgi:hypothetical protein